MDGRTVRPTKQQCKGPLMALFKEITSTAICMGESSNPGEIADFVHSSSSEGG